MNNYVRNENLSKIGIIISYFVKHNYMSKGEISMIGLLIKLVICPITLILSDSILTTLNFASTYQAIIVGVVFAIFAHILEVFFLMPTMIWMNNLLDFIAAIFVIYLSQYFISGAYITLTGATLASIFINVTELIEHYYLVRSGNAKKDI
ncbi:hypothetical protein K144316041_12070 [Clostridium tetani]|uniref:DUF2512 family protein n=2 Tax=Clostridium tetani TaxID=1513 RepID=A0ABC8EBL9_CLOTA|nr:hypothetical protein [Clostridium tetani]BDR67087.1 hypothetical protein K144312032_13150 [Clostridium tetani]BDR72499.1 hypothetical protein K144316041_12070 [Clostridium tetani]BDR80974.1 hypothetical protein K234311028_12200 [Clostridium tetani]BDR89431.1 hypothetical protein N072000002_12320 [Clostridium tetani]